MPTTINHYPRLLLLLAIILMAQAKGQGAVHSDDILSSDKLLIVGLDADYAPLEYVDEQGNAHGYDVDFTNELMKRLGRKFTYAPNKWENISGDVLKGHVDLAMMIYSPYRKDSTNYSRAVFRLYYQVVYRKSDEETFSFRNLEGKHIAYMKSRPVGQMLKQEKAIGHQVTNMGQTFLDLEKGKYDALICFRYQARYFFEKFGPDNLKAEDLSIQPREYCYVSHSKTLIDAINRELKLMDKEGIIDDIYGDSIKSQFDHIEIPDWVWYLLGSLIVAFLTVLVVVARRANKRLAAEHHKLADAYNQLAEKNAALVTANARAEESSRMKTQFIQQISHELRTPLNILNGFTQVLTSPHMELTDDERIDISKRMTENSERMTKMVNMMLEISDASSMTVIERSDSVTVKAIAMKAIQESNIEQARHVSFTYEAEPDVWQATLSTNLRMSSRALSLLLDNAQKFTTEGQVRLSASFSSDHRQVVFAVEDTGIGIAAHDAERIFDAFVQIDDYYDGTGIGLTIARSIVRRLGGDIMLDSQHTAPGTRFLLSLPLADSDD